MGKFSIGDRVMAVVDCPADNDSIHAGDTGTICSECGEDNWLGVCWDSPIDFGHGCDGHCEYGLGWRVPECTLDFEPKDTKPPFQFDEDAFDTLFS